MAVVLSSEQHGRPRFAGLFVGLGGGGLRAVARRAVTLICAGWVPQDRVSSQSPPSSVGRDRRWRLPIGVSRMLWREVALVVPAAFQTKVLAVTFRRC
jgi:hypothetical protein